MNSNDLPLEHAFNLHRNLLRRRATGRAVKDCVSKLGSNVFSQHFLDGYRLFIAFYDHLSYAFAGNGGKDQEAILYSTPFFLAPDLSSRAVGKA